MPVEGRADRRTGGRRRLAAGDLGTDDRRDLGAEQLHRAQHVGVGDRPDAHLADVALVAEQLVAEQDLLGDLLGRAGGQRAIGRAQRLVLALPGGRPAALAPDAVHDLQVARRVRAVRRLGALSRRRHGC